MSLLLPKYVAIFTLIQAKPLVKPHLMTQLLRTNENVGVAAFNFPLVHSQHLGA